MGRFALAGTAALTMLALAAPAHATTPGANGKVAFVAYSEADYSWYITTVDADGSNRRTLFQGDDPAWSPDGSRLAFSVGDPDHVDPAQRHVWTSDPNGGDMRPVGDHAGFDPTWSPDGSRIAFVDGTEREIDVVNADGTGFHTILTMPNDPLRGPSWSPDGKQIAFSTYHFTPSTHVSPPVTAGDLYLVAADGSNPRAIAAGGGNQRPDWSPDGKTIAFTTNPDPYYKPWKVETIDPATATRTILPIPDFGDVQTPAYSPDGKRILFLGADSTTGLGTNLHSASADGASQAQVTDGFLDSTPSWQPLPKPTNHAPSCASVRLTPDRLDNDGRFHLATLVGGSDPDGDRVKRVINHITTDENVGDTYPDAKAVPGAVDRVWLRGERSRRSDGRVYRVKFTLRDEQGATCTGVTNVTVPRRPGKAAVDSGGNWDAYATTRRSRY